ncbi:MAG: TIGR03960 family B12-binding radical SAM protein [Clostridia bacterium]|nr:TIGR03960 family B12-binding radical SAM protein [Clostridia bacterium]
MKFDFNKLEQQLGKVEKPARYVGNELNIIRKEEAKLRFALLFPDVYEIGMSHLGSRIIYNALNSCEDVACERAYAPWPDMEKLLRENAYPLYSLETYTPLGEFDIIGFSLLYEMCYTNILTMLELSSIPFLSKDRAEDMPIVVCGGPCTCNSEPIADIFDAIMIGDGEELVVDVAKCVMQAKEKGCSRHETLIALSKIEGVYIPSFYEPQYENGSFKAIKKIEPSAPDRPTRRIVKDLDKAAYIGKPIVPFLPITHDRIALEIFRGCTRGCRFCQAGFIYRPVREREIDTVMDNARSLINCTGYDEISLFSLSSGDYSKIHELVPQLIDEFSEKHVSLALPSLRIDSFLKDDLEKIQSVRKTGLTFAPEAGTQRLRDVINKGVTEEDLLRSVSDAFESGWNSVKLYFMIGLPTETDEDILGIADLARKVSRTFYSMPKEKRGKGLRLVVSASSFVPKPFTPFQWEGQDTLEELRRKQLLLKDALKGIRGVEFSYHESVISELEAVFARGDRRLAAALIEAYKNGARFDSWDEHFKKEAWEVAFEKCGIDGAYYANRRREESEVLPWSHIDMIVTEEYLKKELEKALEAKPTKDCRKGCNGCFGNKYADYCKV